MARPLHVGYVLDRWPVRSQTFVSAEIAEMRRRGVDISIVALQRGDLPAPPDPPVFFLGDELPRRTWRTARAWSRLHPGARHRSLETLAGLGEEVGPGGGDVPARRVPIAARWLASRHVDLLHAHFAWQGAGVAWAVSPYLDVPWAMTVHANDMWGRIRNLDGKLAAADDVVTVCDYNLRHLRETVGYDGPARVVICGVHVPDEDSVRARRAEPRSADVVAVGRLVEKKGFDTLISAMALVVRARPDATCTIVGEGPWRDRLAAQIDEQGIGGSVQLAGARDHADVLDLVGHAGVFCLPARIAADGDRDSMPLVIKEALARAVPVVATDEVGNPEMVDEHCGRLVPVDDVEALAAALLDVLGSPRADELGWNGYERARDRFDLRTTVAALHDGFDTLVH